MRFKDKTFIITGGTSGMGFAVAQQLASGGGKVIITGRTQTALDNAARQLKQSVQPVLSDAANLADIRSLMHFAQRTFGKLDGVFANAGAAIFGPVEGVLTANERTLINIIVFRRVFACSLSDFRRNEHMFRNIG
jgi:NAD(P)-dependent dehydrogenase (short-subunit alcohol dehydrogenase family)